MNFLNRRMLPVVSIAAIVLGALALPPAARSDDQNESAKKKNASKFTPPKLPDGYGTPKWDVADLEKQFVIIKCEINDMKQISFLLELKSDAIQPLPIVYMNMTDKDDVKLDRKSIFISPNTGKKGDRVRATQAGPIIPLDKDNYAKTATLKFVLE